MRTSKLLKLLLEVGDIDICKRVTPTGYNAGIEFDDDSYLSVPGKTLKEALQNLADDWRISGTVRANTKPLRKLAPKPLQPKRREK